AGKRAADFRRDVVGEAHRAAGDRSELAEDGGFLNERGAERDERAITEDGLAVELLLVVLRYLLQRGIVVLLADLDDAAGQFHAAIPAEGVDAEGGAALHRARGDCLAAADERRQRRIVEEPA